MKGKFLKKIRTFGLLCVTAASIVLAGSGLAAAEVADIQGAGTTTPPASSGSGTGSAALVEGIAKLLATGSAGGPYCPGGAGCPKP